MKGSPKADSIYLAPLPSWLDQRNETTPQLQKEDRVRNRAHYLRLPITPSDHAKAHLIAMVIAAVLFCAIAVSGSLTRGDLPSESQPATAPLHQCPPRPTDEHRPQRARHTATTTQGQS